MLDVRRRELIVLLGGAAAAWPLAARAALASEASGQRGDSKVRAQQSERMRRIGVLHTLTLDDPDVRPRDEAFLRRFQQLGWHRGRNVQIDYRWGAGNPDNTRKYAAELVALAPDVILATGSSALGPLLQTTRTVPIVFVIVPDPVGSGFVDSLARPGGNATGFLTFEFGISGKWLELLKEVAPRVTRAAVIRDPAITAGIGQWGAIQTAAPSLGVEVSPVNVRDGPEIEHAVETFARIPNGGLSVTAGPRAALHRDLIIKLSERHKLPAVYYERNFVAGGGLISYGPDFIDQYRRAAAYVDGILKGAKPADLPVQAPTKYELVINLKTAKALGLDVPPALLARADEVIE
jgi:putative ABC transport system substrate-binding protein